MLLGVFAVGLLACVFTGQSILYAMAAGFVLFFGYGLRKQKSVKEMLRFSVEGVKTAKNVLLTFLLIGVLTAVWRASGSIAFIVYHASKVCTPNGMLLVSFLLCCLISFLTGTSFGSAATMGVICMTMAKSMGISTTLEGGAILAGIYFGDRCSPVSTSALLVSEVTGTDLFDNLKQMAKSAWIPFGITCLIYGGLGLSGQGAQEGAVNTTREVLARYYHLSLWTLLPVLCVLILSVKRVNVKITLGVSAICAGMISVLVQGLPVTELLRFAWSGFTAKEETVNRLMSGGGILSNLRVIGIVSISSCYAGMFQGTGFLAGIETAIGKWNEKITAFGTILVTAIVTAAIACNQTLSIMLTNQLCGGKNPDKKKFALALENTAVVIAPLIPWSIAGAVPLAAIGAPTASVCAACYLYLLPLWSFVRELWEIKTKRVGLYK